MLIKSLVRFGLRKRGLLLLTLLALTVLALVGCAPVITLSLTPQVEAGVPVAEISADTEGILEVVLRDGGTFVVPPGHFPPPGECRIWYPELLPGRGGVLAGRAPRDAVLL